MASIFINLWSPMHCNTKMWSKWGCSSY